jgi:hypothetical protein
MYLFGRLSVTPLYCLVDLCSTPENYHFVPGGVPILSRESIMKLARIILDGPLRNRAVDERDRRAEPRGVVKPRLGVPKGVCPLRGDSTRGLAPL